MQITGTHFNYNLVCHRKLWLFANSIQTEHTSDLGYEGKLVHENHYSDPIKGKEVPIGRIKHDCIAAYNKVVLQTIKPESSMMIWVLFKFS